MSMFDLTGKVALVTGGSMGLGLTFTDVLAEHGADLAITARSADLLEENAKGLRERHGRTVTCHAGDVTNENDVRRVVAETIEQHGRIDILVNNAGISDLRGLPSEWSDHETFRRVVDVARGEADLCASRPDARIAGTRCARAFNEPETGRRSPGTRDQRCIVRGAHDPAKQEFPILRADRCLL